MDSAFDRMHALHAQGIPVTLSTASTARFKLAASWADPSLPMGGGMKLWGNDPVVLLDQLEDAMEQRGVQFKPTTRWRAFRGKPRKNQRDL